MRKIRVAHVITRLCKGGAQENVFHSVRLANKDRFDVDLIAGFTPDSEANIEDMVRDGGVSVIREPGLIRNVAPLTDLRAFRSLAKLFAEKRYDIVHTHTSKAGFVGRMAAKRAGVPIIVHTPHGNVFHGYFAKWPTRFFVWMERYAARYTHRIIELTPGGIDEHLAEGIGRRKQFVTIFSGIDFAPFDAALDRRMATRQALGISPDELLIGGVGRLEPVKGFTYLVEAARRIVKTVPNARFILAGQGALLEPLTAQAKDLGPRFQFLGLRHDVPDLMAAMDIFVLSSINEGMGRVLLEAGAAGTPSVAARVGGVPDIIKGGKTGILIPPHDPESIADAVCALARDSNRRDAMGRAARAVVVPHYGLDRMVARIETLYEELIQEVNVDA